jgi:hypothetical protein
MDNNRRAEFKLIRSGAYVLFVALCFYFLGGITVYKQPFPFDQIREIKNKLVGGSLPVAGVPKPRNELFETFIPKVDYVVIGDSLTEGALWNEIFPTGANPESRAIFDHAVCATGKGRVDWDGDTRTRTPLGVQLE